MWSWVWTVRASCVHPRQMKYWLIASFLSRPVCAPSSNKDHRILIKPFHKRWLGVQISVMDLCIFAFCNGLSLLLVTSRSISSICASRVCIRVDDDDININTHATTYWPDLTLAVILHSNTFFILLLHSSSTWFPTTQQQWSVATYLTILSLDI